LDPTQDGSSPAPRGALLESLDGELEAECNPRVNAHLKRCSTCRERLNQLREGLQLFERSVAPLGREFSFEEGVKQLSVAIRESEGTYDPNPLIDAKEMPSPVLDGRLVSELSIYVGRRTAKQLLECCDRPVLQRERILRSLSR